MRLLGLSRVPLGSLVGLLDEALGLDLDLPDGDDVTVNLADVRPYQCVTFPELIGRVQISQLTGP